MENNHIMRKYLLFDLDGTLTDPKEGITRSAAYALARFGIEADPDSLTDFIGPPLLDSYEKYFHIKGEDGVRAVQLYRERFSVKGLYENKVYPGIPEQLAALKEAGYHLAVATSKPELFALQILEHFNLAGYFETIAGGEMDEAKCTKSYVIGKTLARLGIDRAGARDLALMIGDREHDVLGAAEYGIPCLGAGYGYGRPGELIAAGAAAVADTPEELSVMIGRLCC